MAFYCQLSNGWTHCMNMWTFILPISCFFFFLSFFLSIATRKCEIPCVASIMFLLSSAGLDCRWQVG